MVIMIERGMASTEINVVLKFHKNRKITIITRNAPSRNAPIKLLMDVSIKSACLNMLEFITIPGGSAC